MKKQNVLIVGLTGEMGGLAAERILASKEYAMMPFGIVSKEDVERGITFWRGLPCVFFEEVGRYHKCDIKEEKPIIIDFTHKDVIRFNWENYYREWECPLIVGTIGMKKEDFIGNEAPVIVGAPNLCPQVVAVLKIFSQLGPGSLEGVRFEIIESHQSTKTEVSGTALQMKEYFERAGALEVTPILSMRERETQLVLGVPEKYLDGHGWHTYNFFSEDEKKIQFLIDTCHGFFSTFPQTKSPVVLPDYFEEFYSKEPYKKDRSTMSMSITSDRRRTLRLSHDVNGRQPYIDGLMEVLHVMTHILGRSEEERLKVRDMFTLYPR